jgi:hypothetical protein
MTHDEEHALVVGLVHRREVSIFRYDDVVLS